MEQPVFLIVLVIILPVGSSEDMCMGGSIPCPRDRPYCTEVGCVYQCPDQYLINGTTCVWSCGDAITDLSDKRCISTCPTPGILIFEEVVGIGNQLRKQKVCIDDCNKYFIDKYGAVAYQFGNTCVKACPDEAIFLLDNTCVTECPNNLTIRLNITDLTNSHVLIGVECRSACYFIDRMSTNWNRVATPVIENNFCVERCSGRRLVLENGTCVDECPALQNLTVDVLLNTDNYESMCVDECLDSELLNNSTGQCVKKCPSELPYVYNRTCVDMCPSAYKYLNNVSSNTHCMMKCSAYRIDEVCVTACPINMIILNMTCIRDCPNEFPIVEANHCVSACSRGKVSFHGKCRWHCPKDMYIFNGTCVQQCPVSHPLIKPDTVTQLCIKQCDPGYFRFKLCVERCNDTTETTHTSTCSEKCPNGKYSLNDTCISETECATAFDKSPGVLFNGECMQHCPDGYLRISDTTCQNQILLIGLDIAAFLFLVFASFCYRGILGDIPMLTRFGWWFVTCKKTYDLDKYKATGMKRTSPRRHEGTDPVEDTTDLEGLGERITLEDLGERTIIEEEGGQQDSLLYSVPTVVKLRNHLDMAEFNDPVEIQIDIHDTSPLRRLTSDEAHRQLSESEPNGSEQEEHV